MDSNPLVAVIIGLVTASSIYIWKSNEFNKTQKTFILFCLILPPLQWIMILLAKYYNYLAYKKSKEFKKEVLKYSEEKKIDNSKTTLQELKDSGIITEEEYKTKVEKIENQKTELAILNSKEYAQLKSLLDSNILTTEEFENKVKLISIVDKTQTDLEEEIATEDIAKDKNSTSPFLVISIIIIASFALFSLFNNKHYDNEDVDSIYINGNYPNTTNNINSDSPRIVIDNNDIATDTISKVIKNTLVLFENVNEIYPGETSLNEVKTIMGEPDFIDQTKTEYLNGNISGGNKLVKYLKNGITLIFDREDVTMSIVDAVLVEKGFDGISDEGIYIGMTKENCLAILNKKYFLFNNTDGECISYSKNKGTDDDLQIWFKNEKLDKLKIFR